MFELAHVTTADHCLLHGAVTSRTASQRMAFLLVHGTGSNFYAPGVLERFAIQASNSGATVCRINTRGHDGIASIPGVGPKKSLKGGATSEVVGDCVHDITAWCDFLVGRGHDQILLVGHSMGAVKSIYSQAHAAHAAVAGIVCISPPRFCHQHWIEHARADAFRAHWRRANELINAGQQDALLECTQPTPFLATAAGFVEKYGPADRYDYLPLLNQLQVPALVIVGSQTLEASPAFDGLPRWIESSQNANVTLQIVAGANMNYSEHVDAPFDIASKWLAELL